MYNLQAMQIVNRIYPCEGNKLKEKLQIIPSIDQRQQQLNQQFISQTEIQFVYNEKKKRSKTSENLSVKHKIPLWKCKKKERQNKKKWERQNSSHETIGPSAHNSPFCSVFIVPAINNNIYGIYRRVTIFSINK